MNRRIRRFHGLTRREREIMDVLHKLEKATVADVLGEPESTCSAFTRHWRPSAAGSYSRCHQSCPLLLSSGIRGAARIRVPRTWSSNPVTNATITFAIFSPPIDEGSMGFA